MTYETFQDEFVRQRPIDEMTAMLQYVCGRYPKCFFADFYERQPLAPSVLDDLMQREGWSGETATSILKFYHRPWEFRLRFKSGMNRLNLDGKPEGKLVEEDAKAVRTEAQQQRKAYREKLREEMQLPAAAPQFVRRQVPIPDNPAISIITGVKALKEKLRTDAEELAERMRDTFPAELVELFPDLERSISKVMDGVSEIIEYCQPKAQGEAA